MTGVDLTVAHGHRARRAAVATAAWLAGALLLGGWAAPTLVHAQDTDPACLPADQLAPVPAGPITTTVTDSAGVALSRVTIPVGADPTGIAVDATDPWGRVFVAARGDGTVSAFYGRSAELALDCRLPVGGEPGDLAVDPATGHVLVAMTDTPRMLVLDGRGAPMRQVQELPLSGAAGQIVIHPDGGLAWVTMPGAGRVAVLAEAQDGRWAVRSEIAVPGPDGPADTGSWPTFLALDPERGRLVVGAQGQDPGERSDLGRGQVLVYRVAPADAAEPGLATQVGEAIPASIPTGVAFDRQTGTATILENGDDRLLTLAWAADGDPDAVPARARVSMPFTDEGRNLNPVDLILLPGTRELLVTMAATREPTIGGHLQAWQLDDAGRPRFDRTIPAAQRTRGIALDPTTGRIFVGDVGGGAFAAYAGDGADAPSEPPPPPATLAQSMPSPTQISLAPEDIARTVGISLLVLLLVGAPTPLFNETLESHVVDIGAWLRRRLGRGGGGTDAGSEAAAGPSRLDAWRAAAARAMSRFSGSLVGIAAYTAIAALIYSFLSPGFPSQNGLLVFGVAFLGLALATIADILPGDRYVLGRYRAHGRVRVALWTLVLAAGCVLIGRLANLNPGYMYGIIGTFTFAVALTVADEGRMEARGAVALLVLALAAWFARIPFSGQPGVPLSGPDLVISSGLVGIFVVAVEGLVFGLIPLSFLPGQRIFRWNRAAWAILWGAGLALFAHVLVYPVTVAQPDPDPASLQATLVSVAIYGAVAVGFWAAFRWRDARLARGATAPDERSTAD